MKAGNKDLFSTSKAGVPWVDSILKSLWNWAMFGIRGAMSNLLEVDQGDRGSIAQRDPGTPL